MTGSLRNRWPLYLVTDQVTDFDEVASLPTKVDNVVLVSASFTFARSFCRHLENKRHRAFGILRVTNYNRALPVKRQSGTFVQHLDKRWGEPPSVTAAAYCVLCVQANTRSLEGVNSGVFGSPCQAHGLHWSPQFTHKQLPLNALSSLRLERCTATVCDALRETKEAWLGLLYFARVMRKSFPDEVLDIIVCNATSCEELVRP